MIKSYAANPHIRNSTTMLADSVITSQNLIYTKAATAISPFHATSVVPTLLTGSLSAIHPNSNDGNSFVVKDASHYFLVDSNRHHDSSKSKVPIASALKNVIHNTLAHNEKIPTFRK